MFSILSKVLFLYLLLAPLLTIVHFTFLNGTVFIVHTLILIPLLIGVLGLSNLRKIKFSHLIFSLVILFFLMASFVKTSNYLIESLSTLMRFVSCFLLFYVGYTYYSKFLNSLIQAKILKYGIAGLLLGVLMFYLARGLGYVMTHSITADGALAGLIYVYANFGAVYLPVVLSFVFLSGKSANLVAFASVFVIFSLSKLKLKSLLYLLLFVLIFLILFQFKEQILPYKLNYRLDLATEFLSGDTAFDSAVVFKLTSGRNVEIIGLLEKWNSDLSSFYFGSGLYTITEYGEGVFRSTIHMSYMKIIDMIGIFGFLVFFVILMNSLYLSLKHIKNKVFLLFSLYVIVQLILSVFQYSLLQDPMLWISYGILSAANRFLVST